MRPMQNAINLFRRYLAQTDPKAPRDKNNNLLNLEQDQFGQFVPA